MSSNFCVHNCDYFVDVFERHYLIHINFMQISLRKPFLITLPSDPYSWSWSCSGTTRCLQVPGMAVRAMLQNPGSCNWTEQGLWAPAGVWHFRDCCCTTCQRFDLDLESRPRCEVSRFLLGLVWSRWAGKIWTYHVFFFFLSKMKKINIWLEKK